jgi:HlyD family secretion protein
MVANVEAMFGGEQAKSIDTGNLQYIESASIKSSTGGDIETVYVANGQMVSKGAKLIKLNNEDLVVSTETSGLKLQSLNDQLAYQQKQLSDYKIYAPIDGTLTLNADVKPGDAVKAGAALGSVADYTQMSFDIPIDELDIAKVQVGQNALVTVDALPETTAKPLAGTVTKVAVSGTSTNGVTTYPVTIQLGQNNQLKGGMNANAQIMISSKQNVLYVPIQAVQTRGSRSFVFVPGSNNQGAQAGSQANGTQSQNSNNAQQRNNSSGQNGNYANRRSNGQNGASGFASRLSPELQKYYANAVMKPVEIGIHNDEYIEIVSGLNEGDTVILPPLAASSSTSQQTGNNAMGGVRFPMGGGNGGNSSFGGSSSRRTQ